MVARSGNNISLQESMGFLQSSRRKQAEKEAEKRRGKSATYTQPLLGTTDAQQADLETFVAEWYSRMIFEKAAEMPRLLQQFPETLGTHYALLVPNLVSFDQFWARYFYRCSLTTILEEWSQQPQHESDKEKVIWRQKKELQMEIEKGLGSRSSDGALLVDRGAATGQTTTTSAVTDDPTLLKDLKLRDESIDHDIVETISEEEDD
jgi:hypothetical protein